MRRASTTVPKTTAATAVPCLKKPLANQQRKSSFNLRPTTRPHLKNYLNNAYVLVRSVQYEQFLKALKVDDATIRAASKMKPTVVLTKDNDVYNLTTKYGNELQPRSLKFRLGEVVLRRKLDGQNVRSIFEVYENKLMEKQDLNGKEINIKRKFMDDELLVTMEYDGVKCHRYYKLAQSKHSIETETSRRQSLNGKDEEYPVVMTPPIESVIEDVFDSESEIEELCL